VDEAKAVVSSFAAGLAALEVSIEEAVEGENWSMCNQLNGEIAAVPPPPPLPPPARPGSFRVPCDRTHND
jgi:hypothetical protein